MTDRNKQLFFDIADIIEGHPEWYDQEVYGENLSRRKQRRTVESCGASHCVAGWAAILSGKAVWNFDEAEFVSPNNSKYVDPHNAGQRALVITDTEAKWLFDGDWTPRTDLTVGDALRLIGKGEAMSEVSSLQFHEWDERLTKSLLKSEKQRGLL